MLRNPAKPLSNLTGGFTASRLFVAYGEVVFCFAVCLVGLSIATGNLLAAQAVQEPLHPISREEMRKELGSLVLNCVRLGMASEATLCRTWLVPERPDQQRFYLPVPFPPDSADSATADWRKRFIIARKRYAAHLFDLAKDYSSADDEARAYRLLWQVLREDPQHSQAQKILAPLCAAVSLKAQRRSAGTNDLAELGAVQRWHNRHFEIYSRSTTTASQNLGIELESFYALWTQCFYELWAPPGRLKARMSGSNSPWPEPERMKVYFLASRDEYLKLLGMAESNIGVSIGYYNPQANRSFFYPADDLRETVFHELTHQFFAEASLIAPGKGGAGRSNAPSRGSPSSRAPTERDSGAPSPSYLDRAAGAWCIEGVALYMESLQPCSEGWTLGGVDSRRLQTARYRALRDYYWPLWEPYSQATLADWKQSSDIALFYSHAAGLTHAIFDLYPQRSDARTAYLRYLTSVYSGQSPSNELFELLGETEQAAQQRYRELMTISDEQLLSLASNNPAVAQLVLSRSQLENWDTIGEFTNLRWLDISFSNIRTDQLDWLSDLQELRRLSLEGTQIDGSVLALIAELPNLTELDLSLCEVDDRALAALDQHPSLEVLWLTQTSITEEALKTLQSIPKLRQCDVSSTQISTDAWQQFVSKHPQLRNVAASP